MYAFLSPAKNLSLPRETRKRLPALWLSAKLSLFVAKKQNNSNGYSMLTLQLHPFREWLRQRIPCSQMGFSSKEYAGSIEDGIGIKKAEQGVFAGREKLFFREHSRHPLSFLSCPQFE
ncbi:MAG: hypothetical protein KJ804_06850 [Proteobacteria bacterium]|nr:hypothetical protein [Pseudomonadota bacterium]MBU1058017.1 hypothetical protein [Pseudomonadota bacterium]